MMAPIAAALYLTMKRSRFFALGYAANDVALIGLWLIASIKKPAYFSIEAIHEEPTHAASD